MANTTYYHYGCTLNEWNNYCRLHNYYATSYKNALYFYRNGEYQLARGSLYEAKMALYEIVMNCQVVPPRTNRHDYKMAMNYIPKLIEKIEAKMQKEENCA